jgi:hypothetical protein
VVYKRIEVKKMIKNYAPKDGPVEAVLVSEDNLNAVAEWCSGEVFNGSTNSILLVPGIPTALEVSTGAYLIRKSNGRFFSMPPLEFEEKYKEVGLRQDGFQFKREPAFGPIMNPRDRGVIYDKYR